MSVPLRSLFLYYVTSAFCLLSQRVVPICSIIGCNLLCRRVYCVHKIYYCNILSLRDADDCPTKLPDTTILYYYYHPCTLCRFGNAIIIRSRSITSVRPFRPFAARPRATWLAAVSYSVRHISLLGSVAIFNAFTCRSHSVSMTWRKFTTRSC